MWPILDRYGPFFLYTYSVVLGLGILAAFGVTAVIARRRLAIGWIDGLLLAGFAAMITGRFVYVLINRQYFGENPAESWQIWRGGLNYHGALAGGLLVYTLWAQITGRSLGHYLGVVVPGLALLIAFGWVACWFEGCAYGAITLPGLLSADLPDDFGVFAIRYRTQAAGILSALLIFGGALWGVRRRCLPVVFWTCLGALSLAHGSIALFRGDPAPMVGQWRLDFLLDMVIFVTSILAIMLIQGKRLRAALVYRSD
jgi:phosphatidylglycerol---prolipoprotein diacylglyceryl transferase